LEPSQTHFILFRQQHCSESHHLGFPASSSSSIALVDEEHRTSQVQLRSILKTVHLREVTGSPWPQAKNHVPENRTLPIFRWNKEVEDLLCSTFLTALLSDSGPSLLSEDED